MRDTETNFDDIRLMITLRFSLPLATVLGICVPASGEPRLIDFTDASAWGAIDGSTRASHSYGSLNVTLNSLQGSRPLTFNAPGPTGPSFLKRDGFGIGLADDEISFIFADQDLLEVLFNEDVTVTSLYFFKLGRNDSAQANFGREGPNTILGFGGTQSG